MKIFRVIALSLVGTLLIGTTGFAYKERVDTRFKKVRTLATPNDLFLSDFASMTAGSPVTDYSTAVAGSSKVEIAETKGSDGKNQTALLLDDRVPGAEYQGAAIARSFAPVTSGMFGIKMRFKFEATGETDFAGFQIAVNNGNNMILRIYTDGDNGSFYYIPSGPIGNGNKLVPGEWYTLHMIFDLDKNRARVLCQSDVFSNGYSMLENLEPIGGTSVKHQLDNINIASRYHDGQWWIDYLRVEAGKNLDFDFQKPPFKHPDPIPAPITTAPVMRAVPGRINVNVNGEYKYFATTPAFDGEDLMVNVKSAFRALGMNPLPEIGGLSASYNGTNVSFTKGSANVSVGGSTKTMSKAVDNNLVSLNSFAEAMGYTAEWNADENTMYITGGAAE